ncbi:MAG: hypothetical protein WKF37_21395, partial [Bryobacteraceae bacterium]
ASASTAYSQSGSSQPLIVGRISSQPPASPAQIAELEGTLVANPSDLAARTRLLTFYQDPAPGFGAARLRHILYLIENLPGEAVTGSPLAYVPLSVGPHANPGDHELLRGAWLRAAEANLSNADVQINAARLLHLDHPEAAEDLLTRRRGAATRRPQIDRNSGILLRDGCLRPVPSFGQ